MKTSLITILVVGMLLVGYALTKHVPGTAVVPSPKITSPVPSSKKTPKPINSVTPSASLIPSSSVAPTASPSPVVTASITSTPTPTLSQQTHIITMQNFTFTPSTLTVPKGDRVTFKAIDTFYSVVIVGRSSGRLQPGQEWTLDTGQFLPGTYQISESTHTIMRGTLIIQ